MLVIRSRLSNLFRKLNSRLPSGDQINLSLETSSTEELPCDNGIPLETIWEEEWRKNIMEQAIRKVKSEVPMEHYQIFDFYVLKEMDGPTVARTLGIGLSKVYVIKHRVSKLVRQAVRKLEAEGGL
jgi:hypothetical protein